MKLDRNSRGRGKYALIKLRQLDELLAAEKANPPPVSEVAIFEAIETLQEAGVLDYGDSPEAEFFVIRLRDKYARIGLEGYAMAAVLDDPEYAEQVMELAERAGPYSPFCKAPD